MNKIIAILSLIAGILALTLSFTPIGQLAYLPAVVGVLGGLFIFMKDKKNTLAKLATIISLVAVALISIKGFSDKTSVKNDQVLEQKEAASKKEAVKDLEELDGLE